MMMMMPSEKKAATVNDNEVTLYTNFRMYHPLPILKARKKRLVTIFCIFFKRCHDIWIDSVICSTHDTYILYTITPNP